MLKNSNTVSPSLAAQETVVKNFGEAFGSPRVSTNLHDRRDADNGRYSQNRSTVFVEARQETIDWLVANNFPALPVAPQQEPHKYPKRNKNGEIEYEGDGTPKPLFTGKNPSYLDKGGIPHLINHHKYRERLPTQEEYGKWFGNPQNGVGTLGGWNDATWIDLDVKNFESASNCEEAALEIIEKLAAHFPYFEKTHSGGYRILIGHPDANKTTKECQSKITNFALEPGGKHVGECLSKGRFTVLAPTVGTSGNSYENINRAKPVPVEDLADIGIYSSRSKQRKQSTTKTKSKPKSTKSSASTSGIDLEKLINPNAKQILYGNSSGDRSADLAAFIQEVYGWLNWCNKNNIPFSGDAYDLSSQAGEALGIDSDRRERIVDGIDLENCVPAAFQYGDIPCWKKIKGADKEVWKSKCPQDIFDEMEASQKKQYKTKQSKQPAVTFNQQVYQKFFSGDWICADRKLYKFLGTYYELVDDSELIRKITAFANSYKVATDEGEIKYPYAHTKHVTEALNWAKNSTSIKADKLNPPGINCTNGIVRIEWDGRTPQVRLVAHSPEDYYTYKPLIQYNPLANPEHCSRLLRCLEPAQQQVLLRNLGASLDLSRVREIRGREVKILLCAGLGSNGKDALREVVSTIYGKQGITSVSLADFASYDTGRKFPLAPLRFSRVNWASENPQTERLDRLQSLKLFATGNLLHSEQKGKDHVEFVPKGIGLFNVNESPALEGTMQAIKDRIAVLAFNKTFKNNPNPSNPDELLADPRFAYDPEFVQKEVAPAFLNMMLEGLKKLAKEGIDYSCCEDAFVKVQKENNHLFQFCEDLGLVEDPNGTASTAEIWAHLEQWYFDNEILQEIDGKRIWHDQVRPSDKNVKSANQVMARFKKIFPKAQEVKIPHPVHGARKAKKAFKGISFSISTNRTPIIENRTPNTPPVAPPKTTQNQYLHPQHPQFLISHAGEYEISKENNIQNTINCETEKSKNNVVTPPIGGVGGGTRVNKGKIGGAVGVQLGVQNQKLGVQTEKEADLKAKNLKPGTKITCYPTHSDKELITAEIKGFYGGSLHISWEDCEGFISTDQVVEVLPDRKWWDGAAGMQ